MKFLIDSVSVYIYVDLAYNNKNQDKGLVFVSL